MTHIAGEVVIDAAVDEVFDMVADERNEPRYNPRIVRVEKANEGPVGAGARFVAEPKSIGSKGEMTLTILEYDRPHRLRNVVRSSYMQVDGALTFEKTPAGRACGGTGICDWSDLCECSPRCSPSSARRGSDGTGRVSRSTWRPAAADGRYCGQVTVLPRRRAAPHVSELRP